MSIARRVTTGFALCVIATLASCSHGGDSAKPTATPANQFVIVTRTPGTPQPTATRTTKTQTYVVQAGDSLLGIANMFDVTLDELQQANGIEDPDSIFAGQRLKIPAPRD